MNSAVGEHISTVRVLLTSWCLNGEFSKSQDPAISLSRRMLEDVIEETGTYNLRGIPKKYPPGTVRQTTIFIDNIFDSWLRYSSQKLINEFTHELFKFQHY